MSGLVNYQSSPSTHGDDSGESDDDGARKKSSDLVKVSEVTVSTEGGDNKAQRRKPGPLKSVIVVPPNTEVNGPPVVSPNPQMLQKEMEEFEQLVYQETPGASGDAKKDVVVSQIDSPDVVVSQIAAPDVKLPDKVLPVVSMETSVSMDVDIPSSQQTAEEIDITKASSGTKGHQPVSSIEQSPVAREPSAMETDILSLSGHVPDSAVESSIIPPVDVHKPDVPSDILSVVDKVTSPENMDKVTRSPSPPPPPPNAAKSGGFSSQKFTPRTVQMSKAKPNKKVVSAELPKKAPFIEWRIGFVRRDVAKPESSEDSSKESDVDGEKPVTESNKKFTILPNLPKKDPMQGLTSEVKERLARAIANVGQGETKRTSKPDKSPTKPDKSPTMETCVDVNQVELTPVVKTPGNPVVSPATEAISRIGDGLISKPWSAANDFCSPIRPRSARKDFSSPPPPPPPRTVEKKSPVISSDLCTEKELAAKVKDVKLVGEDKALPSIPLPSEKPTSELKHSHDEKLGNDMASSIHAASDMSEDILERTADTADKSEPMDTLIASLQNDKDSEEQSVQKENAKNLNHRMEVDEKDNDDDTRQENSNNNGNHNLPESSSSSKRNSRRRGRSEPSPPLEENEGRRSTRRSSRLRGGKKDSPERILPSRGRNRRRGSNRESNDPDMETDDVEQKKSETPAVPVEQEPPSSRRSSRRRGSSKGDSIERETEQRHDDRPESPPALSTRRSRRRGSNRDSKETENESHRSDSGRRSATPSEMDTHSSRRSSRRRGTSGDRGTSRDKSRDRGTSRDEDVKDNEVKPSRLVEPAKDVAEPTRRDDEQGGADSRDDASKQTRSPEKQSEPTHQADSKVEDVITDADLKPTEITSQAEEEMKPVSVVDPKDSIVKATRQVDHVADEDNTKEIAVDPANSSVAASVLEQDTVPVIETGEKRKENAEKEKTEPERRSNRSLRRLRSSPETVETDQVTSKLKDKTDSHETLTKSVVHEEEANTDKPPDLDPTSVEPIQSHTTVPKPEEVVENPFVSNTPQIGMSPTHDMGNPLPSLLHAASNANPECSQNDVPQQENMEWRSQEFPPPVENYFAREPVQQPMDTSMDMDIASPTKDEPRIETYHIPVIGSTSSIPVITSSSSSVVPSESNIPVIGSQSSPSYTMSQSSPSFIMSQMHDDIPSADRQIATNLVAIPTIDDSHQPITTLGSHRSMAGSFLPIPPLEDVQQISVIGQSSTGEEFKSRRKRKSRWGPVEETVALPPPRERLLPIRLSSDTLIPLSPAPQESAPPPAPPVLQMQDMHSQPPPSFVPHGHTLRNIQLMPEEMAQTSHDMPPHLPINEPTPPPADVQPITESPKQTLKPFIASKDFEVKEKPCTPNRNLAKPKLIPYSPAREFEKHYVKPYSPAREFEKHDIKPRSPAKDFSSPSRPRSASQDFSSPPPPPPPPAPISPLISIKLNSPKHFRKPYLSSFTEDGDVEWGPWPSKRVTKSDTRGSKSEKKSDSIDSTIVKKEPVSKETPAAKISDEAVKQEHLIIKEEPPIIKDDVVKEEQLAINANDALPKLEEKSLVKEETVTTQEEEVKPDVISAKILEASTITPMEMRAPDLTQSIDVTPTPDDQIPFLTAEPSVASEATSTDKSRNVFTDIFSQAEDDDMDSVPPPPPAPTMETTGSSKFPDGSPSPALEEGEIVVQEEGSPLVDDSITTTVVKTGDMEEGELEEEGPSTWGIVGKDKMPEFDELEENFYLTER